MDITVAIDCMGGDHGPHVTVPAALNFLKSNSNVDIVLVGLRDAIEAELRAGGARSSPRLRVHPASEVVLMDESPALALRNKKDSSMRVAVDLIKNGEAQACVSAGNTGALMAVSRFVLKTLPGIDRPAIIAALPSTQGSTYVLDLGANVDCGPEHLLQFAIMGATLVAAVEHKDRPSVGLLNIGEEDIKGNEVVKRAAELLRQSGLNFIGNIEGDGIYRGEADVVVCDGFTGNVVLKASESLGEMVKQGLKTELTKNIVRKSGALLAKGALSALMDRMDYTEYGGAPLLGVKGGCVICHGRSNAKAIKSAIRVARNFAVNHMDTKIREKIGELHAHEFEPV